MSGVFTEFEESFSTFITARSNLNGQHRFYQRSGMHGGDLHTHCYAGRDTGLLPRYMQHDISECNRSTGMHNYS